MAGKHYSAEEVKHIIDSKNAGQSWEDIVKSCNEKFSVIRTARVLKIVYNRETSSTPETEPKAGADQSVSSDSSVPSEAPVAEVQVVPEP